MQSLTIMTLAALMLGGATYAVDVAWAEPRGCGDRTVSIYFEKDEADFSEFSRDVVERVAAEAKLCSGAQVIAQTPPGDLSGERAEALGKAFAARGVDVILTGEPQAMRPRGGSMADRAAIVRIAADGQRIG